MRKMFLVAALGLVASTNCDAQQLSDLSLPPTQHGNSLPAPPPKLPTVGPKIIVTPTPAPLPAFDKGVYIGDGQRGVIVQPRGISIQKPF